MPNIKKSKVKSFSSLCHKNKYKKILCIGIAATFTQQAWSSSAQTTLGSFGQTQLQRDTGDAVQLTCGGFVASGADSSAIPLFATCSAMVQTANELAGSGGMSASLGLTEDQLAASLQQIATEEFAATESMANEISNNRMTPVITRLVELRGGATGFSVAGLVPHYSGKKSAQNGWPSIAGISGGAAGDDELNKPLGGFINGSFGSGDRDSTAETDGFAFDSYNTVFGVDYRVGSDLVLGVALSYYDITSDFDTSATVSGGGADAAGWGASAYATWYKDKFYVDALVGYAKSDYDMARTILIQNNNADGAPISEVAESSSESADYTFSVGGGYNFNNDALEWGPYFRATYSNVDMDSYQESGAEASGLNLFVNGEKWDSLTTVLGIQASYVLSQDFGVVVPNIRVGWVKQFENDAVEMTAVYVDNPRENILKASTSDADTDYTELSVGFSAVFNSGVQAFFNYDTLLAFDGLTTHLFTLGMRSEF